jgi:hypothetical protein
LFPENSAYVGGQPLAAAGGVDDQKPRERSESMIWILDEKIIALRPATAEDCAAEMAETHGVDLAEFSKQPPEAKMEQKQIEHPRSIEARDGIHLLRPLSDRVKNQLIGPDKLRRLAKRMTILLRYQSDRTERKITNGKRLKREMGKAKEIAQKAFEDSWVFDYLEGADCSYGLLFDRDGFEASIKAVLPDIADEDIDDFIREKQSGNFTESELVRILAFSEPKSKGPIQ